MRYLLKERKHIEELGGRALPLSGQGRPWEDGIVGNFQIQLKITRRDFYDLREEDLADLIKHSVIAGHSPLFVIYFERYGAYALVYFGGRRAPHNQQQKSKRITPTKKKDQFTMCGSIWNIDIIPRKEIKGFVSKLCEMEKEMR